MIETPIFFVIILFVPNIDTGPFLIFIMLQN